MKIGDTVQIISLNTNGVIDKINRSNSFVVVKVGALRVKVLRNDIKILENIKNNFKLKKNNSSVQKYISKYESKFLYQNTQNFIDLHQKTVQEAIYELENFIDEAIFYKFKEIKIIHGKGTGVLRREIGNFLRRNKKIKSFRTGFLSEGGTGVTIILL